MPVPRLFIQAELNELNKQFPLDIGDGQTLRYAHLDGGDMIYRLDLALEADRQDMDLIKQDVQGELRKDRALCQDMAGYFNGPVERIIYSFNLSQGRSFETILAKADCEALLRPSSDQ